MTTSLVWNYFEKIPDKPHFGKCNICKKEYSCKTSTTNLKKHLESKHSSAYENLLNEENIKNTNANASEIKTEKKSKKHQRQPISSIWNHFERISDRPQSALCNLCNEEYSCKTSVTNLKKHLMYKHKIAYQNLLIRASSDGDGSNRFKGTTGNLSAHLKRYHEDAVEKIREAAASNDEVVFESDEEAESIHGQDIYFEEVDEQIKCTICGKNLTDDAEDPRGHLEEHHPGLLARIIKDEDKAEQEEEAENEKDIFTEVVYLDQVSPPPTIKRPPQIKKSTTDSPRKRKLSFDSDDYQIKTKKPTEIESFTNYIRILLEKLPQDVCSRLQLEIINLIMAAQFNLPSNASGSVASTSTIVQNVQE